MDLTNLSVAELKSLLEKIPAEIKRRETDEKKRIRKELEELAAKSGYSLDELLGEAAVNVAKVKKPVAVKYRHPQDASLTWSGRGKRPRWTVEFLTNGGTLEQLAV